MWHRWLNWAAIALVGSFGLIWLGVVIFATESSALWARLAQAAFGLLLIGWAAQKSAIMVGATDDPETVHDDQASETT